MKHGEILRSIMKQAKVKNIVLADRLGLKPTALCNRLDYDAISVYRFSEMLQALDYKIIIVPRDKRVLDGEYELK